MSVQFINTPAGRMVIIPEDEFRRLAESAEDAEAGAAIDEFRRRLTMGQEERIPADMVDRMLSGASPVRVWREHRSMTAAALANAAGISGPYLSQIENGAKEGSLSTMKAIAEVLGVTLDDLVR